jgi:E3 SUMO-protein ligase PIAS1
VRFKESPFFRVLQTVSTVQECPGLNLQLFCTPFFFFDYSCLESSSATDRRQQLLTFNLTNEHIAKLKSDRLARFFSAWTCTLTLFLAQNISFGSFARLPCFTRLLSVLFGRTLALA